MFKRIFAAVLLCAMLLSLSACALSPLTILENVREKGRDGEPAAESPGGFGDLHSFEILFDPNGGDVVEGRLRQRVVTGGMPDAPLVERDGYTFEGWSPAVTAVTEAAEYTAEWKSANYTPEEIFARISPAVAEILVYDADGYEYSLGSGFFIDDEGTLVTNYHVIEDGYSAVVTLSDGSEYDVLSVEGYDPYVDIAMLRVDTDGNEYLRLSDEPARTGETVYALGSSLGLTNTFSSGIVSTAAREYDGVTFIQTTTPISHGNSGGPLVDSRGFVIGINTMTMSDGQNMNFALDASEIGKLDVSAPVTMAQFYEDTYVPAYLTDHSTGFYSETDYYEIESNDSILLSDGLPNDEWVAGEVYDIEDFDWFYIELDEPTTVLFEVLPYYVQDDEYLLCAVVGMTDDDFEVIEFLEPTEERAYNIEDYCELALEPGLYFLCVTMSDDYPDDIPLYYAARATW